MKLKSPGTFILLISTILIVASNIHMLGKIAEPDGIADSTPITTTRSGKQRQLPAMEISAPSVSSGELNSTCHFLGSVTKAASSKDGQSIFVSKTDSMLLIKKLERNADDANVVESFLAAMCHLQFDKKNAEPSILSERKPLRSVLRYIRRSAVFERFINLGNESRHLCQAPLSHREVIDASPDWRKRVLSSTRPLQMVPFSESHAAAKMQTSFSRAPKHASWVTIRNVCATCESLPTRRQFFMHPGHSCHMTLWSVGDHSQGGNLRKLVSFSRRYRNAIFKEREGAFQYGGHWKAIVSSRSNKSTVYTATGRYLDEQADTQYIVDGFVPGTTTLVPSFHVDNVGHVIHDAVWALQITLLLGTGDLLNKTSPDGLLVSSWNHTIMFSHEFVNVSSEFYGFVSTALAARAAHRRGFLATSPFGLLKKNSAICFEQLVVSGQDRHVDGGGSGLRDVVARSIRRDIFAEMNISGSGPAFHSAASLLPRLFVYGRNDMHRRSLDNTWLLKESLSVTAQKLGLSEPQLISTFSLSPPEQIALARRIDFFVTVQGAHMQHSLFMPEDAVIFEIAPCHSELVSFLRRYGRYLETQRHIFFPLCDDVLINFSQDPDQVPDQNLTLCPRHVEEIAKRVEDELLEVLRRRRRSRNQNAQEKKIPSPH